MIYKKFINFINGFIDEQLIESENKKAHEKFSMLLKSFYGWSDDVAESVALSPDKVITKEKVTDRKERYFLKSVLGIFSRAGFAEELNKKYRASIILFPLLFSLPFSLLISYALHDLLPKEAIKYYLIFIAGLFSLWVLPRVVMIIMSLSSLFGSNALGKEINLENNEKKSKKFYALRASEQMMRLFRIKLFNILPVEFIALFLPAKYKMADKYQMSFEFVKKTLINDNFDSSTPSDLNDKWNIIYDNNGNIIDGRIVVSDAAYSRNTSDFINIVSRYFNEFKNNFLIFTALIAAYYYINDSASSTISQDVIIALIILIVMLKVMFSFFYKTFESMKNSPMAIRTKESFIAEERSPAFGIKIETGVEFIQETIKNKKNQINTAKQDKSKLIQMGSSTGIFSEKGMLFSPTSKDMPMSLSVNDLNMHLLVLGETGSGKTVLAKKIINEINKTDVGALILDGKYGYLPKEISIDIPNLKLINPDSVNFGMIEHLRPHQIAEILSMVGEGSVKNKSRDFFTITPKELIEYSAVILEFAKEIKIDIDVDDLFNLLNLTKDKGGINDTNIANIIGELTSDAAVEFLYSRVKGGLKEGNQIKKCMLMLHMICRKHAIAKIICDKINSFIDNNPAESEKIAKQIGYDIKMAIDIRMNEFMKCEGTEQNNGINATLDNWFGSLIKNIRLKSWLECESGIQISDVTKGEWFGVVLPKEEFGAAGPICAKFANEQLNKALRDRGNIINCDRKVEKDVFVFLDEGQNIVTESDVDAAAMGRSLGLHIILITQNIPGIVARLGDELTRQYLGNLTSLVAFKTTDESTSKFISNRCGDGVQATTNGASKGFWHDIEQLENGATCEFQKYFNINYEQRIDGQKINTLIYNSNNGQRDKNDKNHFSISRKNYITENEVKELTSAKFHAICVFNRAGGIRSDLVYVDPKFEVVNHE